jgi:hypothetical protein
MDWQFNRRYAVGSIGGCNGVNEMKMKPQEQRLAIARHRFPQFPVYIQDDGTPRHTYPNGKSGPVYNYTKDLNACMDLCNDMAGKGLLSLFDNGLDKTWEATFSTDGPKAEHHYGAADTLAEAICEAYLKAVGKWVEEKEEQL